MRCKAGRTGGPADEDFELSRFFFFVCIILSRELVVVVVVVV